MAHAPVVAQANILDPEGKVYCGATSPTQGSMIGSTYAPDMHPASTWQGFVGCRQ